MVTISCSLRRQLQIESVFHKYFVEHNGRIYKSKTKAHELCPRFYAFRLTPAQCEAAATDWLSNNDDEGCTSEMRLKIHEWDRENRRLDHEYNGIYLMGDIDDYYVG